MFEKKIKRKMIMKSIGFAAVRFIFEILYFLFVIGILICLVYLFVKHPYITFIGIVGAIIIAIIAYIAKYYYNLFRSEMLYIDYLQDKSVKKLNININEKSVKPIHKQIKSQIIERIYLGDLKKGEPLPEIRSLVWDLMIKGKTVETTVELAYKELETTVELAYKELENDGIIYCALRKYFIVKVKSAGVIKWLSQN